MILAQTDFGSQLNRQVFPGIQGGPLMHVIAAKAVAFKEALTDSFRQYQRQTVVNARTMARRLMDQGVALVSGGTDNHMMLADLTDLGVTGKEAEAALGRAGITANKNAVPFDTRGPQVTSGIRLGSPVLTTRGMGAAEMETVADIIAGVLKNWQDDSLIERSRARVQELCEAFPLYGDPKP